MLANVADDLAASVAQGLGMALPAALPKVMEKPTAPEVEASPALSLFARPGDGSIRTRRIAILVADGVAGAEVKSLHEGLAAQGAVPRFVGARLGSVAKRGRQDRSKSIRRWKRFPPCSTTHSSCRVAAKL